MQPKASWSGEGAASTSTVRSSRGIRFFRSTLFVMLCTLGFLLADSVLVLSAQLQSRGSVLGLAGRGWFVYLLIAIVYAATVGGIAYGWREWRATQDP